MSTTTYQCPKCGETRSADVRRPDIRSPWGQDRLNRVACKCGSPMIPQGDAWARCHTPDGMLLWSYFLMDWSTCPNAHICNGFGMYDDRCEQGKVMQRCFAHVNEQMGSVQQQLAVLQARQSPSRLPGRQGPKRRNTNAPGAES